jgi:hypothetical protein
MTLVAKTGFDFVFSRECRFVHYRLIMLRGRRIVIHGLAIVGRPEEPKIERKSVIREIACRLLWRVCIYHIKRFRLRAASIAASPIQPTPDISRRDRKF